MKTSEFIKRVAGLGYNMDVYSSQIFVKGDDEIKVIAIVKKDVLYDLDTNHIYFESLDEDDRKELFDLLVEYASTPVEDRKEYQIKFAHLEEGYNYLIYMDSTNKWLANNESIYTNGKMKFSLDELPYWVHEMLEQGHLSKEEAK